MGVARERSSCETASNGVCSVNNNRVTSSGVVEAGAAAVPSGRMIRGGVRVVVVLFAVVVVGAGCSGSGHMGRVTLAVSPSESVFDVPVKILVKGVEAKASVTVSVSSVDSRSSEFRSSATFVADGHGRVDPAKLAPSEGDYAGIARMGLFTSLHPTGATAPSPLYFWSRSPQAFTITATSGTRQLAKAVIMRRGFSEGVTQTSYRLADT